MNLLKRFVFFLIVCQLVEDSMGLLGRGVLDINLFKCIVRKAYACPHEDITFYMYSPSAKRGKIVDVTSPSSFVKAGYQPQHESVFIIHGFNGTQDSRHITYLKDAYLSRKFNVITVDWQRLTRYPCYVTALANTKLVSQCTAQVYAFLTHKGSSRKSITCVGHSLGAHICGMMTNHLTSKQYKIIGLDPAKPLVEKHAPTSFRLTRDDASVVQIIHTNAGGLGQLSPTGSIDFCVNGGRQQPYCRGHAIHKSRCSHFLSVCYLASSIFSHKKSLAVPCPNGCLHLKKNQLPIYSKNVNEAGSLLRYMQFGQDTPDHQTGTYCVQLDFAQNCPFSN